MIKKLKLQDIIKSNPRVNRKTLKEIAEIHDELKKLGLTRKGYGLGYRFRSPSDTDDPRTIYLRRV